MKIYCADGINAVIPEHLKDLKIDAAWLEANGACSEGRDACLAQFPEGATYPQVRKWVANIGRQDWENWLLEKVGGDTATAGYKGAATAGYYGTATAGDCGTATAGYRGTATAGYYGTATAGTCGTASAGNYGTATAGDHGTATVGDRGTATAGDYGTATAGDYGTITIKWWEAKVCRHRLAIGYIGEKDLKPNVKYKLDDNGNFIEA